MRYSNQKRLAFYRKKRALICTRYKFYNFPNIFCSSFPLPKTYFPCNHVWFPHRNRGISLRLNMTSRAHQIFYRTFGIDIVKTAYSTYPFVFRYLLYPTQRKNATIFYTIYLLNVKKYVILYLRPNFINSRKRVILLW